MKPLKLILQLSVLFFLNNCFSQNYSYSFKGKIDSSLVSLLAQDISKIHGVKEVKWRFKQEKQAGEFIIFTTNYSDNKDPYPFDPTHVKALLIASKLEPLKLIELPN